MQEKVKGALKEGMVLHYKYIERSLEKDIISIQIQYIWTGLPKSNAID